MDWKTFTVEMIKALIWPVTTGVILVLFRQQFIPIIARLTKVKIGNIEAEWGNRFDKVTEGSALQNGSGQRSLVDSALIELAEISPRAAILEAWLKIEREISRLAEAHDISTKKQAMFVTLKQLGSRDVLNYDMVRSLQELSHLRNLAVHAYEQELTAQKAKDFVVLTQALLFSLGTKQ